MKMMKRNPVSISSNINENLVISRVKQYLEDNVHQTYVDVGVMAKSLHDKYEEYSKHNTQLFRKVVEQAYKTVLHSYGLDSDPSSPEETSDLEVAVPSVNSTNHINDMLTNLYTQTNNRTLRQVPINEAIDIISSDEEDSIANQANNQGKGKSTVPQISISREIVISKVKNKEKPTSISLNIPGDKRNAVKSFFDDIKDNSTKRRKVIQNNDKFVQESKSVDSSGRSGSVQLKLKSDSSPGKNSKAKLKNSLKKFKKVVSVRRSHSSFRDVGGMDKILKELCELLFHIKHPGIYHTIGLSPPKGILLHGPSGCGKTFLAEAIAGQLQFDFIEVPATELIAGVSGESEERIREVFEQAVIEAPCVLFIDDIDAISSNRLNAQRDMERRIVSQLISCMDNLCNNNCEIQMVVIGATTRPDALDPALRRVGRFDHEIAIGVPDRREREQILKVVCDFLSLEMPFNFAKIAELTPGYVGADLVALTTKAASIAVKRKYFAKLSNVKKTIPIVDLIEDSNMQDGDSKDNDKVEIVEDNEKEKEKSNNEQNGDAKVDDVEKENKQLHDDKSKAEDASEHIDKPDEEMDVDNETQSNEKIKEKEQFTKNDSAEKSIVDKEQLVGNIISQKSVIETANETIDVDELTDEELTSSNIQEINTENDFSLIDMMDWLSSDSIQIKDVELESICITLNDFEKALKVVQPSAKREGFITVPDITWDDIGSLRDIREELQLAILAPVKYPEKMQALGLQAPSGVLLCGPPGCGKTLLAKAIANEAGINFISVKGPELMNMYVGESERAVRTCFQRARTSAPCVIFFDEFDSLCPKRSNSDSGGSGTRVVNQLLTEMDGIDERKGVFLMAATNRPDIIDPAILRPGRLDTILYVGLPESKDRIEILNALTKNRKQPVLSEDVDLSVISSKTSGFTGADLAGLVRQASLLALKESLTNSYVKAEDLQVTNNHFMDAIKLTKPSVTVEDRKMYEKLRAKYAAPREVNETQIN